MQARKRRDVRRGVDRPDVFEVSKQSLNESEFAHKQAEMHMLASGPHPLLGELESMGHAFLVSSAQLCPVMDA